MSKVDGSVHTTDITEFDDHVLSDDDTYDAQAESASLSSDEWVRQSRAEVSDPYMVTSKKEWNHPALLVCAFAFALQPSSSLQLRVCHAPETRFECVKHMQGRSRTHLWDHAYS